jgi:hypothetical protein
MTPHAMPAAPWRWKTVLVAAAFLAVACSVFSPTARQARADNTPGAVRNASASINGDTATLRWDPPLKGAVARYVVHAYPKKVDTMPDFGTRMVRPASVGATTMTWDRLPLNNPVQFTVSAVGPDVADPSGYGGGTVSGDTGPRTVIPVVAAGNSYCPAGGGSCVVVNTTAAIRPETRPGAGMLHGTGWSGNAANVQLAQNLKLRFWRIQALNDFQYKFVVNNGLAPANNVIELLSDGWIKSVAANKWNGDPWADWNRYRDFVRQTVEQSLSQGRDPYWEIQNEPETYSTYSTLRPSRANVEQQYLEAYNVISEVYAAQGKTPRIIGPSISWVYESNAYPIDMKTFIPFAAAHGMKFAAIAWHENSDITDLSPLAHREVPQNIRDDVATVRTLIAENPGIGSPQIFVDENSSPAGQQIPGFTAGYLAEQDRAGVDEANRSAWPTADHWSSPVETNPDTFGPSLGLLVNRTGQPNNNYWVMADYASMNGDQVRSATSDDTISSLAVRDVDGKTRLLLGRHQTCAQWIVTARYCNGPSSAPDSGRPTAIQVLVPKGASTAHVTVQRLAASMADSATAPAATVSDVSVQNGVVTINVPAFRDGEAYFLEVTPNVITGAAPASGDIVR